MHFSRFCQRKGIALIPFCLILLACAIWTEMEILVPSLPEMKHHFAVSDAQIQQLLSANFVGFLLGVLIAGPLCDSLGRKFVAIWGGLLYLLCCLICIGVEDFNLLVIARFFQGLVMTGPLLAGGVLLFDHTSGSAQIFWMSLTNSIITFCMALAPIIGSWITGFWGYRGNLWFIVLSGALGILPLLLWVPESLAPKNRQKMQLHSLARGYLALLCDWRFMICSLPVCGLAAAYWIYVGISALYMVDYLGIAAGEFGRYQGPIVGCFSLVSLGSARLLRKFGLLRCLQIGLVAMFSGLVPLLSMSLMGQEHALFTTLAMMSFVGGMAPICSLLFPHAMNHLPPEQQGKAQALIQAMRLGFASLGTSILGCYYRGPFLPVATMLMLLLVGSSICLWLARGFCKEKLEGGSVALGSH
jgi:MFS family permease